MKKIPYIIIFICLLFSFPIFQVRAARERVDEGGVIRVGWYEEAGYFQEDADGDLYGFGRDYLDAVSQYTGWEYEFVRGTRQECLKWLESGQIDILSPVGVTEELSHAATTREVIGDDYGYLYKLSGNVDLNYNDFSRMETVTLGMVKESGLEDNLLRFCEENEFTFSEIRTYDTLEEAKADLVDQKIDVMLAGSFVNLEDLKVVGRFSNGQVAFAARDEWMLSELNRSMEQIKLNNPEFTEDLRQLYFSEGSQNNLEYTVREREFLSEDRVYKVALGEDQFPISYHDENGNDKGIALEVLERIEHHTGIKFEIIHVESYLKGEELLKEGKIDILGSCIIPCQGVSQIAGVHLYNPSTDEDGIQYTKRIHELTMSFVGEKNVNTDMPLLVAVPSYFAKSIETLESIYPDYEYVIYPSDEECIQAIFDDEVDVAVQSDLKINELAIYDEYQALQNVEYIPGNYTITFALKDEEGFLLGILDKAIETISESEMSTIINSHNQRVSITRFSFWEFIRQYQMYFIAGIVLIGLLMVGQNYYRKYRVELKNKERAYRDSIANISSMEKFRLDVSPIIQGVGKGDYYALAVDVDKFKVINDLYGYEQGDRMIAFLARMLKADLTENDYISRTTADNFVIMKKAADLKEVTDYLNDVFSRIDDIMLTQKTYYHLILKAGIYQLKEEDNNLSSIIDKANLARDSITQSHRSTYKMYMEDMRQQNIFTKNLENEMEEALKSGQFKIYLQPQVDFVTKKIVSAEALVRWKHPGKGMMSPDRFIPIFEKNGFINKLDYFVWEEALKTIAGWRQQHKIMVPIAINLSRVDIQNDKIVEQFRELMDKYGLESHWIKMELTESICLDEDGVILDTMNELKKLGLQIAVDDFGSGYSSLHLLKKMPIDILKIDKSFLDFDVEMDIRDEIVIRDIVEMGKHLNLQVFVEGVESKEQSLFLEAIGCDVAQGYYYGRPMPVSEFERKLTECYQEGA